MVTESSQLGVPTLRLLGDGSTVQILRELTDGPLRPSELEKRLPEVPHSALMRRLATLALKGALTHERIVGLPTRAYYSLTESGEALGQIAEASERWERRWSPRARPDTSGTWPLRLLADERVRAILRALAKEPLRPTDLERLPGVGRSATRRRLGPLLHNGILTRIESDGQIRYTLTESARRLGLIATLAAQWEWHWASSRAPMAMNTLQASLSGPTAPATPATPVQPGPDG